MKVLLLNSPWINTPYEYGVKSGTRWAGIRKKGSTMPYFPFPYHLASLASFLRKNEVEVTIKDCVAEELEVEEVLFYLAQEAPHLVVIEAFTASLAFDLEFAKNAKETHSCQIAFCGAHGSALPKEILNNTSVDFAIIGEFYKPVLNLARHLMDKPISLDEINGLAYKVNGEVFINGELDLVESFDEVPIPLRDELPMLKYNEPLSPNYPNSRIVTAIGCPYQCSFCVEPMMGNRKYRKRSIGLVLDEIKVLKDRYGIREVSIDDPILPIPRARELAKALIDSNLSIKWSGWMDWNITLEDLKLFKKSGCVGLKFGIESSNPKIVASVGKPAYLDKLKKLFINCRKVGIICHGSIMLGLPGDTPETMKETIQIPFTLGLDSCQMSIATPLPGTAFYKEVKMNNWLWSNKWHYFEPHENCVLNYPDCSRNDILKAARDFKRAKTLYFLKNPFRVLRYLYKLFRLQGARKFFWELTLRIKYLFESFFSKKENG